MVSSATLATLQVAAYATFATAGSLNPSPPGCYVTPGPVSFKFAPGNIFNTPNHGVKLSDDAAHCCAMCQSFKNCTFWDYEHGGTAAQPTCYSQAGGCCFLKTASAWPGSPKSTGVVSGSTKPLPPPSPPPAPPGPPPQKGFSFASVVSNGMILAQAPKQAMVWGFVKPGATVTVQLDGGKLLPTKVGPDQATGSSNTWRALLPATAASFDNHTITATSGGVTLAVSNVMFGEVWVCSGQSNMEYPIGSPTCWNASNVNCTDHDRTHNTEQCGFGCTQNAGAEIAAMVDYDSGIRLYTMGSGSSDIPLADHSGSGWNTPSKTGGGFSAACWYYGRDIYNAMPTKVPVGLIATFVGGTPDEHWSSPEALNACTGTEPWQRVPGFKDSKLWNAMVVPLLRTVHSGAIWYQGENNAGEPRMYNCSFPAMIEDWRAKWSNYTDGATDSTFPFGWAQLNSCGPSGSDYTPKGPGAVFNPASPPPNCGTGCAPECNTTCLGDFHEWADYGQGFTGIRFAQDNTLASVANTFQAVIIDTPVKSGSIHSPYKQPVGRRLARGGLDVAYGMKNLHSVDPEVESVTLAPDAGSVVVTVGGLGSTGAIVAVIGSVGFEVLGTCSSKTACAATGPCQCWTSVPIASATATTVTVTKGMPAKPVAIRYLWYIAPYGTIPFEAPIYAAGAPPLPGVNASMSNPAWDLLPLGPFVLPLSN